MNRPGEVRSLKTLEYVLGADPAVVRGFARAATDHLSAGPITLIERDRLLKRAERLGIGRFDANLVLAAVEHRHRMSIRPNSQRPQVIAPARSNRTGKWTAAAAAVALQAVILSGIWWLLA